MEELALTQDSQAELVQQNRIVELGPDHITALSLKSTFDTNSELARKTRNMTYDGLPKELSPAETFTLAGYIGLRVLADTVTTENPNVPYREMNRAQVRAFRWLGSKSYARNDEITRDNAQDTLRHNLGIRGKLAALSLWYETTVKG